MSIQETNMFGQTIEQMEEAKPSFYSNSLYAMAILSDVQELLAREDSCDPERIERARQWINKAKYFIDREMTRGPVL